MPGITSMEITLLILITISGIPFCFMKEGTEVNGMTKVTQPLASIVNVLTLSLLNQKNFLIFPILKLKKSGKMIEGIE